MNILITGGAGFIGSSLAEDLNKRHKVYCLARKENKRTSELGKNNVEIIYGDIKRENILRGLDIDIVYHFAGLLNRPGVSSREYYDTNVNGTRKLAGSLHDRGIKQFVYCSTAAVSGPTSFPANEYSECKPSNAYERTKLQCEEVLLSYYERFDFPATIIRPSLAYGPNDMRLLSLFKLIQNGKFRLISGGKSMMQPIFIGDLVQGFKAVLGNKKSLGETYIFAGDEAVTFERFARIIAAEEGVNVSKVRMPAFFAKVAAGFFEIASKMTEIEMPLTASTVNTMTKSYTYDTGKSRKELGFRPGTDLHLGIKRTVKWYKDSGYL